MIDTGLVCRVCIVNQDIFVDIRLVPNVFLVDQDIFVDIGPVYNVCIGYHNRHWTSVHSFKS